MPNRSSREERRKSVRVKFPFLVQYRFQSVEEFENSVVVNLSSSGMFIQTKEPEPAGSLICFQFMLEDGSKLIEGLGRVIHVNQDDGAHPLGMGIEFVTLDESSAKTIDHFVNKHAHQ